MPAEPAQGPRCGVLGSPIAHSLSPVLHEAAYRDLGLDWTYSAHEVAEAQLAGFLSALTGDWRGLSLTMPLKRAAIGLCDRVESRGRLLQSINTLVIDETGVRSGHNTDVNGFVRALKAAAVRHLDTVTVVGAGATAASALAAVAELGAFGVTVLARTPARAQRLVALGPALGLEVRVVAFERLDSLGATVSGRVDAVISTVPATAQAGIADRLTGLAPVVFDVNYYPRQTPLLEAAEREGITAIPGFELLLYQAARQVELMTGVRLAPIEAMRAAGVAVLDNR